MKPERPLFVECAQCPELQRHGVGAGARRELVRERVVVVVLHHIPLMVAVERPEAIQVDLVTEARGHGVHQEASGGTLDLHLIGQPIAVEKRDRLLSK